MPVHEKKITAAMIGYFLLSIANRFFIVRS
jgi:hypothetical protein